MDVGVIMHDFAITEHYSIILNMPFTARPERLIRGKPLFMFEPKLPSKFGILPRYAEDDSELIWFETSACFLYHTSNAWEEGSTVVLVGQRTLRAGLFPTEGEEKTDASLFYSNVYEWRFNLQTREISERVLLDLDTEFPTINPRVLGRKPRYGYFALIEQDPNVDTSPMPAIVKYDFEKGTHKIFRYGNDLLGGEAIFVPKPDSREEDDGYLMTYVRHSPTFTTELWILDASNFGTVVARVQIPQRVPYGFHSKWVTGEQILAQK